MTLVSPVSPLILVPLPDGRWLGLSAEDLAAALARGAEAMAPARVEASHGDPRDVQWLTAEQMAERSGVDASWFLQRARLKEIPCIRLGKYVRFDAAAVARHLQKGPGDTRTADPTSTRKLLNGKDL